MPNDIELINKYCNFQINQLFSKPKSSLTNKDKGRIGEYGTARALDLLGLHSMSNIRVGRGDIDHIVLNHDSKQILIIEDKNTNRDFTVYPHWFETHILDRFVQAIPLLEFLLRAYPDYTVSFVLVISVFNVADPIIHSYISSCEIKVIETGFQALNEKQTNLWSVIVKKAFSCLLKLPINLAVDVAVKVLAELVNVAVRLAGKAENPEFWLKFNKFKVWITLAVRIRANSIYQAVKNVVRTTLFKIGKRSLVRIVTKLKRRCLAMKLWSIKMKREDGLEFSIILEEEDTQNIIPRAEKVSNSLGMDLTAVHQIFRMKENKSKSTKKGRRGK